MSERRVTITTVVLLSDSMDMPIPAVAASLATLGFRDSDVDILELHVTVDPVTPGGARPGQS